tara:strand:- start:22 stop:378 length:357 start_codon:yes stop_codon:yes gene_type:complete
MFSWFESVNLSNSISEMRLFTLPLSIYLPDWFLYSLPDGLWLFSYVSFLLVVWGNVISKHNIHWVLLVPLIAIFSELGQLIKVIPGTFDVVDLCSYFLGAVLPVLIFANLKTNKPITT